MGWTPDQELAISATGSNLLVAAAAGAGKTAVLVERVIRRLVDAERPLDVDRLLVVTFTEAAAAEMRERIAQRLQAALAADPANRHLRRQLALLNRASISTLHAFCLALIRQYFYRLDLDPGFRVLGENEARLLKQETLDQALEERFAADPPAPEFQALVERYGGDATAGALHGLTLQLYEFTCSLPWPELWLEQAVAAFALAPEARLADTAWFPALRAAIRLELERAASLTALALDLCHRPGGPGSYADAIGQDQMQLAALLAEVENLGWDELRAAVGAISHATLRPARGEIPDPGLKQRAQKLRDEAKDIVRELQTGYLARAEAEHMADLRALAPHMATLAALVQEFGAAYRTAKRAKALADFGDLERCAFQLLVSPAAAPGEVRPADVAQELRLRHDEVLVDEYQDINELQDAILSLVARDGADELGPANRFMVGDVKQSIYRFRQAEPGLFLAKYATYAAGRPATGREPGPAAGAADEAAGDATGLLPIAPAPGRRIDLRANFRSRRAVVEAVNFVFRQVLTPGVGEMRYDAAAELVCQAEYPESAVDIRGVPADVPIEVHVLERDIAAGGESDNGAPAAAEPAAPTEAPAADDPAEYSALEREAVLIARRIRELVDGAGAGQPPAQVWDRKAGIYRPLSYQDIVILLRSPRDRVNALVEILGRFQIPAYAEAATGYFAATEVETALALLQVIDNPRQDIPLATVLRSPMVGLTPAELAQVRLCDRAGDYYDAVLAAVAALAGDSAAVAAPPVAAAERLRGFLSRLEDWRSAARRGPLSRLVWRLLQETGYLDFVAGMPGGAQRRANLLALYDRAREFDQFARQGLFRFLSFIQRLREEEQDLGEAPVSSAGADVVRIFSIHKSKGLEFPVVFVADLGKRWNRRDLSGPLLFDRRLGLGPSAVDPELRIQYPTVAQQAVKRARHLAALAEEMRVLYVALTRARERLILVGSTEDLSVQCAGWCRSIGRDGWALSDAQLAGARSYLDWLMPALARHRDGQSLRELAGDQGTLHGGVVASDPSRWQVCLWPAAAARDWLATAPGAVPVATLPWADLAALRPLPPEIAGPPPPAMVVAHLAWRYPQAAVTGQFAKGTVTELKRRFDPPDDAAAPVHPDHRPPPPLLRPRFLQAAPAGLTPAEIGTAMHLVLQHLDLRSRLDAAGIHRQVTDMVRRELLTPEQAAALDEAALVRFHDSPLGRRLQAAPDRVRREVAFSLSLPASTVYPDLPADLGATEQVLVQGVIDCLVELGDGLLLIDFKTDHLANSAAAAAIGRQRYGGQIALYRQAVATIHRRPVTEAYIYFLKVGEALSL